MGLNVSHFTGAVLAHSQLIVTVFLVNIVMCLDASSFMEACV